MTAAAAASRILTLVFTDLADSMALKMQRGDQSAGELMARHRAHTSDLAAQGAGRIIDWAGDGCFLTFESPSAALLFALRLQQVHGEEPHLLGVRVGLHLGEVRERIDSDGDVARSRMEGLAVDLAARICGLARPAQGLMSPAVADSARQRWDDTSFPQPLRWHTHGGYRVKGFDGTIELAAARMVSMSAPDLLERLTDRFRLLSDSRRGLERHQTLRQAVQWSYDLLTDEEKTLLGRSSVFAGGFDLQAASSVCGGDDLDEYAVLDVLDSLVRKSLVSAELIGGHMRLGLLETIRQFAEEQLAASGGIDKVRDRHARYFATQSVAH